jgi:hypothetical protein
MTTFYRGEGVRFSVLHRYVRRLIDWATTPSDEEAAAARNERRLARVADRAHYAPLQTEYAGMSPTWLAERKADLVALRATDRVPPLTSAAHLRVIDHMERYDGQCPPYLFQRPTSAAIFAANPDEAEVLGAGTFTKAVGK